LADAGWGVVPFGVVHEQVHEIKRFAYPHTAGAEDPVAVLEEAVVVGVVEVDRVAVGEHEFDPTEGVFVAGELDETVGDRSAVLSAGEFGKVKRYLFASLEDVDVVGREVARVFA